MHLKIWKCTSDHGQEVQIQIHQIYTTLIDPQNEMRTVLPKSDQYLDDALDFEKVGIDEKKRKDIYVKWQKYMNDELPGLPMFQGKSITIVNDKVRNLDIEIELIKVYII